ncbi:MAG: hypothetical protein LUE31_06720 [Lachnospiraceae bacterium]|nr:hypothetical protein [Lachnospiraceae bacterium]
MTLFNRKKKAPAVGVLDESSGPARVKDRGNPALPSFFISDHPINDPNHLQECYDQFDAKVASLIETTDRYSSKEVLDAYVDGQILVEENQIRSEAARKDWDTARLSNEMEVRKGELDREMAPLKANIDELDEQIEPLKGKRSHFTVHLGNFRFPLSPVITILAMACDAFVNFSFLQNILTENFWLLILTVLCLSVLSDGTMYIFGNLYSQKGETFLGKRLYYTFLAGLLSLFLLSVVTSVLIRFGSMSITFGTVDATGAFVGKEGGYTLAEYGVTLATAFLTTATGIICLVVSVDPDAPLETQRLRLEKQRAKLVNRYETLAAERHALELAPDPAIYALACREVAWKNLEALRVGLRLHARKLLALHVNDADFTDEASESGKAVLNAATSGSKSSASDETSEFPANHDLKEVV